MPVYATVDDYVVYTGVPIPAPVSEDLLIQSGPVEIPPRIMTRASNAIDKALVGAVYDTDDTGMPTDSSLVEIFRDATCAQARHLVDCYLNPPPPNMPKPMPYMEHLSTEAFDILRSAGLIPITLRMRG